MESTVASYVQLLCDVAAHAYQLPVAALLRDAGLHPDVLDDAELAVPEDRAVALLRRVLDESGDEGLGLRLAHALDLRTQGFFGYALLSSSTMRERVDVHLRYQKLRGHLPLTMTLRDGVALFECTVQHLPSDLAPVILDFGFAGACIHHRRRLARADSELALWMTQRERSHHAALRALVGGPVVFEAPVNRLQMPARDLDMPLAGDPHLAKLARARLEAQLEACAADGPRDLLARVRRRLEQRLGRDTSLDAVAADLKVSARTLRRHLGARGVSYQSLLEEIRLARATALLSDTNEAVEHIAAQLGYGDPSNFRRAFKRWTGRSPRAYRADTRAVAG